MNVYYYRRPHGRLLLDTTRPNSRATPSNEAAGTENNGHKGKNFDSNMVIILAALLCALLCALALHLMVRCALRCRRGFGSESLEETAGRLNATGEKNKRKLCQIPMIVYGSGIHIRATDCPICLGEFLDGEDVRVLPKCHHGFHVKCIDIWLASHYSCPTCRQSLLEQPSPCPEYDAADDNEAALRLPSNAQQTRWGSRRRRRHCLVARQEFG